MNIDERRCLDKPVYSELEWSTGQLTTLYMSIVHTAALKRPKFGREHYVGWYGSQS